jgi:hypothetical protein
MTTEQNSHFRPALTQEQVRKLFTYDYRTGIFTRNTKSHNRPIRTDKVWITFKNGQKRQYSVAKLIWCYMKGDWEDYVMRVDKDIRNTNWNNFRVRARTWE